MNQLSMDASLTLSVVVNVRTVIRCEEHSQNQPQIHRELLSCLEARIT